MPYISVVPLQVSDLDAAKRFYTRTLGFNLVMDERMEGEPTLSTWAERGVKFIGEIVEHSWARFIPFTDPDGNQWILSELPKPWNLAELPSPAGARSGEST